MGEAIGILYIKVHKLVLDFDGIFRVFCEVPPCSNQSATIGVATQNQSPKRFRASK